MQLAMIGPGRMGASMVRRLIAKGHACAIWLMVSAEADFANQVLSAMRHGFGGHIEKKGGA